MIPRYFLELKDKDYQQYFDNQYPDTEDCITLDKQILDIQKDINEISQREISNYFEYNYKITTLPSSEALTPFRLRTLSKIYLNELLSKKRNLQSLLDCRNKIETIRQEETAQVFTDTSAKAETRVLTDTKNKQYLLIGVGAVAVLTVVYLVTRKK